MQAEGEPETFQNGLGRGDFLLGGNEQISYMPPVNC
jgi:hypothetical protein